MGLTANQGIALALIPKFGGFLSFVGSGLIVRDAMLHILGGKDKKQISYFRLMIGMSFCDICQSFMGIMTTWFVPRPQGANPVGFEKLYYPAGNEGTCRWQGFSVQFAAAGGSVYFAALTVYFVLWITCNWNESQMKRVELGMHLVAFGIGLGTALPPLALGLYGNAGVWCWIVGEHAAILRLVLCYVLVWIAIVVAGVCMGMLYWTVHKQEVQMQKYTAAYDTVQRQHQQQQDADDEDDDEDDVSVHSVASRISTKMKRISDGLQNMKHNNQKKDDNAFKRSRQVRNQAFGYVMAYVATWFVGTINRVLQTTSVPSPFWLLVLHTLLAPTQGLFNAVVYFQKRYSRERANHPDWPTRRVIISALNGGKSKPLSSTTNTSSGTSRGKSSTSNTTKSGTTTFNATTTTTTLTSTVIANNNNNNNHNNNADITATSVMDASATETQGFSSTTITTSQSYQNHHPKEEEEEDPSQPVLIDSNKEEESLYNQEYDKEEEEEEEEKEEEVPPPPPPQPSNWTTEFSTTPITTEDIEVGVGGESNGNHHHQHQHHHQQQQQQDFTA